MEVANPDSRLTTPAPATSQSTTTPTEELIVQQPSDPLRKEYPLLNDLSPKALLLFLKSWEGRWFHPKFTFKLDSTNSLHGCNCFQSSLRQLGQSIKLVMIPSSA